MTINGAYLRYFMCTCRIAVFSNRVLKDDRIVIIAEQRPDCSEEEVRENCQFLLKFNHVRLEMPAVRVYQPRKNAMQSGHAGAEQWVLEYETETPRVPEPLMGWTQADDTLNQVKLKFDTLEAAQKYADDKGFYYSVQPERERKVKPRNYGDNFRYIPPEEAES